MTSHLEVCLFSRRYSSLPPPPTPESRMKRLQALEHELESHVTSLGVEGLENLVGIINRTSATKTKMSREREDEHMEDCDNDVQMLSPAKMARIGREDSDMELARQMQLEEERERDAFRAEEERLFQEYLQRENHCVQCKTLVFDRQLHTMSTCGHRVCSTCVASKLSAQNPSKYSEFVCGLSGCNVAMTPLDAQMILTPELHDRYLDLGLQELVAQNASYMRCPKCDALIERLASSPCSKSSSKSSKSGKTSLLRRKSSGRSSSEIQRSVSADGVSMSPEAALHKKNHRFRCAHCNTEFCAGCNSMPYHPGYTCEQYQRHMAADRCRFCDVVIAEDQHRESSSNSVIKKLGKALFSGGDEGSTDVCTNSECVKKWEHCCRNTMPCGHKCIGIKGESKCLGCLQSACGLTGASQNAGDMCSICWVEDLCKAPCIKLDCGHIFHLSCVEQKLASKWSGARINFVYMECALCKQWMNHPAIAQAHTAAKKLFQSVTKRAVARLRTEPEIAEELRPGGMYYGKEDEYALQRYAFYLCHRCRKPYFGGMRRCDQNVDEGRDFDPTHLVCGSCSSAANAQCAKHGAAFIEYKCKFCCSVASWFCWGTTHFCDECHRKQGTAESMSKKPKNQLPVCPGSKECPIGGNHPPGGEEFVLGCALCRR